MGSSRRDPSIVETWVLEVKRMEIELASSNKGATRTLQGRGAHFQNPALTLAEGGVSCPEIQPYT